MAFGAINMSILRDHPVKDLFDLVLNDPNWRPVVFRELVSRKDIKILQVNAEKCKLNEIRNLCRDVLIALGENPPPELYQPRLFE
jgi:hypothetical protein